MPALVTGATGFVGAHLVRALLQEGRAVRCLVRDGSPRANLDGLPVELCAGDLRDRASVERAVRGCELVFHCAADYRLFALDPAELDASNVAGTRSVLAAAAEAGARRIVYTSSVGALSAGHHGAGADETTPVALRDMVGHYKRSKFLAEAEAIDLAARGAPIVVVNRSTPVGEGDRKPTPTGQMILDYLNRRMPAYVATGLNLIDVRDVATGHLLAAARGRVGERYILGHRNLTLRELLDTLARLTGQPPVRLRLPHALPLCYAALDTALARWRGRSPRVPLEAARMARKTMFFDAAKARRELSLPQTPVEDALARAVDWFRAQGYVVRGPLAAAAPPLPSGPRVSSRVGP